MVCFTEKACIIHKFPFMIVLVLYEDLNALSLSGLCCHVALIFVFLFLKVFFCLVSFRL